MEETMRVVIALDGSQASERGATAVAQWAKRYEVRVHLLTVMDPEKVHETFQAVSAEVVLTPAGTPSGQSLGVRTPLPSSKEDRTQALVRARAEREDYLRDVAARSFPDLPVVIEVRSEGDVPAAITAYARGVEADAIVMATRHHGRGAALFGTHHEAIVRMSSVPVLLVGPNAA
jgi:nucleotide-binding universal stress UspA family protein